MSFQSRQKKRRYKRAVEKSKRHYADETAESWFLTLAKRDGKCSKCGDRLKRGAEVVYRHRPCEVRCVRCGQRSQDSAGFRLSLRWEKVRRKPSGKPKGKRKYVDALDRRVPGSFGTGER
jgi:ribosomal protein S27E